MTKTQACTAVVARLCEGRSEEVAYLAFHAARVAAVAAGDDLLCRSSIPRSCKAIFCCCEVVPREPTAHNAYRAQEEPIRIRALLRAVSFISAHGEVGQEKPVDCTRR
jgi:hypothetical protein